MFEWENALAYFIRFSMAKVLYIKLNPLHQIKGYDIFNDMFGLPGKDIEQIANAYNIVWT
jgi:hypothetical protein